MKNLFFRASVLAFTLLSLAACATPASHGVAQNSAAASGQSYMDAGLNLYDE